MADELAGVVEDLAAATEPQAAGLPHVEHAGLVILSGIVPGEGGQFLEHRFVMGVRAAGLGGNGTVCGEYLQVCALASEQINILSADFFTRSDGVVVNIFRICTTNFEPVSSAETRKRFLQTFDKILHAEKFEPEKYLKRRANFLKARNDHDIPVPVRAYVSNELHPTCTTVEIQALDRIGLLHDLFHTINSHDLETVHARISTEKGVAMDTLYITEANNGKVSDPALLEQLEQEFTELIGRREQPE